MPAKLPRVIMHDSVSLDGSFVGFEYSPEMMKRHYRIAGGYGAELRLIGATTCLDGMKIFGGFSRETAADAVRPQRDADLSYWVIVDSRGRLRGKLHYLRRSEFCRDVVVLVSKRTPARYLEYLRSRNYDFCVAGTDRVDLRTALRRLRKRYSARTVLVDSGRELTNAMIDQGLVNEISLLVLPILVGARGRNLFSQVRRPPALTLLSTRTYRNGYRWLRYRVG